MRHYRHWPSHAIGLVVTVLLHLALLLSVSLGSVAATKRAPEEAGPGSSATASPDESWMTLVVVNLPSANDESMALDVSSRGGMLSNTIIQIISPNPIPSFEMPEPSLIDESGEAPHTAGDPLRQSMLFGRYTGQINARIQRAWRKPRSAVDEAASASADMFRCQARILQSASGAVKEIELMLCNGSPAWQLSLVRAIQLASPLPAPPDPSVFTSVLTLAFDGKSYVPGLPEDEYEPATNSNVIY